MARDMCEAIYGVPLENVRIFDVETTGLSAYVDEIVSISICDGNGKILLDELVRPTQKTSWPEAERIHGISPRDVRKAPTIRQLEGKIVECLDSGEIIAGYNVSFDIRFLDLAPVRYNSSKKTIDVMELYRNMTGKRKGTRLCDCASHYGLEFDAHSSCEDVVATAFCLRRILADKKHYVPHAELWHPSTREMTFKGIKATNENIDLLLIGEGSIVVDGEIRVGEITRGKTKGTKRYECFVKDLCVGVGTADMINIIKQAQGIPEDEDAPSPLPAKVSLTRGPKSRTCVATVEVGSKYLDELNEMASRMIPADKEVEEMKQEAIDREIAKQEKHLRSARKAVEDRKRGSEAPARDQKANAGDEGGVLRFLKRIFG